MHFSTLVYNLALLSSAGLAQYTLEDDYFSGGNFFGQFSFWNSGDPTHGFVQYQTQSAAQSQGLISQSSNNAYMGVDHTNNAPNGRNSVRLTSNKSYNSGLVIVDIGHMPGGICGTWPAFWMVGPNWPYDGEIDIIEGANAQQQNDMTLHTGPSCTLSNNGGFTGSMTSTTCNSANGNNNGCQIQDPNSDSYGNNFNSNGGGVYATQITASAINIWFFPRGSIPSNVESNSPNPSSWGTPLASFYGSQCNIANNFKQLQIVFDTTFCGDWAGNAWGSSSCASMASSCNAYVQNNPSAFTNAYWSVNSLKVFQASQSPGVANSPQPAASSSAAPAPTAPATTTPASGSGPLGSGIFDPQPTSVDSTPAPTSATAAAAPSSTSVDTTPAPSSTPASGSGPLGSGIFTPQPSSGDSAPDSGSNAIAPNAPSSPSVGSNGIINERASRKARRDRHVRQHKTRVARLARI